MPRKQYKNPTSQVLLDNLVWDVPGLRCYHSSECYIASSSLSASSSSLSTYFSSTFVSSSPSSSTSSSSSPISPLEVENAFENVADLEMRVETGGKVSHYFLQLFSGLTLIKAIAVIYMYIMVIITIITVIMIITMIIIKGVNT